MSFIDGTFIFALKGNRTRQIILARDAFVRTNRRAIAMLFVSPSVRPSVCLWMYKLGEALNANNDK